MLALKLRTIAVGSKPKTKVRSCNGGSNGMAFRRESYKMMQRSGNNGSYRVDPITPYSDLRPAMVQHHFLTAIDNDIPGLPLISDFTNNHEYNNTLETELGIPAPTNRSTYCNHENRIHWCNDKEVMTSVSLEHNQQQHQQQLLNSQFEFSSEVQKAIESILNIADHIRKDDDENNVCQLTRFCFSTPIDKVFPLRSYHFLIYCAFYRL